MRHFGVVKRHDWLGADERHRAAYGCIFVFNVVALVAAIALMLMLVSAKAQDRQFTLSVKEPDVQLIGRALGKMPYEDVARLIAALNQQINNQIAAEAAKPAEQTKEPAEQTKEPGK